LAFLIILIYSNTLFSSFHFDDEFMLRSIENGELNFNFFIRPRSIGYLSFFINNLIHGRNVLGYHLFNIFIHIFNSVLFYKLSLLLFETTLLKNKKITKNKYLISAFSSLIFATHPIQTQAITYIVQRLASLSFLFFILGVFYYLKYRLENKNKYFIVILIFSLLSLFTKENSAIFPIIILLIEIIFFEHRNIRKKIYKISTLFVIPMFAVLYFFKNTLFSTKISPLGQKIDSFSYLLTQFRVIPKYIQLLFFPIGQNLDHYFLISYNFFEIRVLSGFLFLLLILIFAFKIKEKYPIISFSIYWFFIGLIVTSSIIPIRDVSFEHRLYSSMVGFSIFLSFGFYYLIKKILPKKNFYKAYVFSLSLIIIIFSSLSFIRNSVWKNDITLMSDVTKKSPKISRNFNWLGVAYLKENNIDLAKGNFLKAIEINPNFQDAHNNLGNIYSYQGNLEKAIFHFEKAISLGKLKFGKDNTNIIRVNLGLAYFNSGEYVEAIRHFKMALENDPENNIIKNYIRLTSEKINKINQ